MRKFWGLLVVLMLGAGSFWKATTDWISGSTDLDTALAEIDASWPQE
jgi:alpha-glucoside transport system substrate-binding protein